jgi:hypothetical protein|tara:strand:+ start:4871 stop:5269 length:399 start_codon:yes stop_codon:yes gene_type:complete
MRGKRTKKHGNYYRSGSELSVANLLTTKKVMFDYEPEWLKYEVHLVKRYLPDFRLPNGVFLEVKGIFSSDDRKKHRLIKEAHPELDIRFVFDNPKAKLYKGAKSTYGEWCTRYGFKYCKRADGIPSNWLSMK